MCGVFGAFLSETYIFEQSRLKIALEMLATKSGSRGKDASALSSFTLGEPESFKIVKKSQPIVHLLRSIEGTALLKAATLAGKSKSSAKIFLGHTRLATHGSADDPNNNQPFHKGPLVGVHNGIVLNSHQIWENIKSFSKQGQSDSESLVSFFADRRRDNVPWSSILSESRDRVFGTFSMALADIDSGALLLSTNHGSLYRLKDQNGRFLFFASEERILKHIKKILNIQEQITQLQPQSAELCTFDVSQQRIVLESIFTLPDEESSKTKLFQTPDFHKVFYGAVDLQKQNYFERVFSKFENRSDALTRCKECILPATIPFIQFNENGVCNFCSSYTKPPFYGSEKLHDILNRPRKSNSRIDSVFAFSGGRDSSYGLHLAVKEFGLKPVAFTYDWGLVTDIARRNMARLCSELKVEHIIVAADIRQKRENVRKNVLAWLKKPHLGMVPLFMAGDKPFFYHSHDIKKELGVDLEIMTLNPLENAQFKEDFTGVQCWNPDELSRAKGPDLSFFKKMWLPFFYGSQFLLNKDYLNSSLMDTAWGYWAYYFCRKNYLDFYNYVEWNENKIDSTLRSEYGWENRGPSRTTWRIGDGTTPFYNYIYYTMAGFTENDTFRSNQVRAGELSRAEALRRTRLDNYAQWEDLMWYCDAIGIDYYQTLETINKNSEYKEPTRAKLVPI